ncbi:MAG: hypothetical protein ACLGHZ_09205 [Actinomycetes bacterium]
MEWLIIVALLGLMVAALVAWRRRRPAVEEDEWTLPPVAPGAEPGDAPTQVLNRDALLNRPRHFDPTGWDDSSDEPDDADDEAGAGGDVIEGDLPRYFDRDYLKARDERRHTEEE